MGIGLVAPDTTDLVAIDGSARSVKDSPMCNGLTRAESFRFAVNGPRDG